MKKATTGLRIKAVKAAAIIITLLLGSFLGVFSSLMPHRVYGDYQTAKTAGAEFTAQAQAQAAADDGITVYSWTELYELMFPSSSAMTLVSGIITPDNNGNQLLNNTLNGNSYTYDYCLTLSSPMELMAFSYAAAGYLYSLIGTTSASLSSAEISGFNTFFSVANVKLGANIAFSGGYSLISGTGASVTIGTPSSSASIVSNSVYDGYGAAAGAVYPFLPINFGGMFDGCGFDVTGLKILRNATSLLNSIGNDAMFSSVAVTGTVKNIGLIRPEFVSLSGYGWASDTPDSGYPVSSIVGTNYGTVEYVYTIGAITNSTAINAVPTCSRNSGSMREYYTAMTNSAASSDDINYTTSSSSAWYYAGTDYVTRGFASAYPSYAKLSGLKRSVSGGTTYFDVMQPADLIAMSQAYSEEYTSGSGVTVRLGADIVCKYISEYAYMPAIALRSLSQAYTLDGSGHYIKGLRISAYAKTNSSLGNAGVCTIYGLFGGSASNYSSNILTVANLTMYGCTVNVTAAPSSNWVRAGAILGVQVQPVYINNVRVDCDITVSDAVAYTSHINIGGVVGGAANCQATTINGVSSVRAYLSNVTAIGEIRGGNVQMTATGAKSAAIGGIYGYVDSAYDSVRYVNVYRGGKLIGFNPIITTYNGSDRVCVGGLIGEGSASFTSTESMLDGVYVDCEIVAQDSPSGVVTSATKQSYCYGGFVGDGNDDALRLNIDTSVKFVGSIVIDLTYRTAASTSRGVFHVGYAVGRGGILLSAGTRSSDFFKDGENSAQVITYHSDPTFDSFNNSSSEFYFGTVSGYAEDKFAANGSAATRGFENDMDITVRIGFRKIYVGGVFGGTAGYTFPYFTNTATITVYPTYYYTKENGAYVQKSGTFTLNTSAHAVRAAGLVAGGGNSTYNYCQNLGKVIIAAAENNTVSRTNGNLEAVGIGYGGTFNNCENTQAAEVLMLAEESGSNLHANGGYVAASGIGSAGTFDNCVNSGTVGMRGNLTGNAGISSNIFQNSGISYTGTVRQSSNAATAVIEFLSTAESAKPTAAVNGISAFGACSNSVNYSSNFSINAGYACVSGIVDTVSATTDILNCTNEGDILGVRNGTATTVAANAILIGGISARGRTVRECVNNGNISVAEGSAPLCYVGGIIAIEYGTTQDDASDAVSYNTNNGNITVNIPGFAGGIVASLSAAVSEISYNLNVGSITVNTSVSSNMREVGGILGCMNYNYCKLNYNINRGAITLTDGTITTAYNANVGGILGNITSRGSQVMNNVNDGAVEVIIDSSTASVIVYAGGVIGQINGADTELRDNINLAAVTLSKTASGWSATGGIVGNANNVSNLYMSGNINSGSSTNNQATDMRAAGGIIGRNYPNNNTHYVYSSLNYGDVYCNSYAGGIVGRTYGNQLYVYGAANYGDVRGGNAGGIIGNIYSTTVVHDAINYGTVSNAVSGANIGGIIGSLSDSDSTVKTAIDASGAHASAIGTGSLGTSADVYTVGAGVALSDIYSSSSAATFALAPANENTHYASDSYYGTASYGMGATSQSTIVWSEYPYGKGTAAAHSANTQNYCYALTNFSGRLNGGYVGSDNVVSPSVVLSIDPHGGGALNAKIAALAQITKTRESIFAGYDPSSDTISDELAVFMDSNDYSLPRASYRPSTVTADAKFQVVVLTNSDYYISHIGESGFNYIGSGTKLSDRLKLYFSRNATISEITAVSFETFNSTSASPLTILDGFFTVTGEGASGAENIDWYTTRYEIRVIYYDSTPQASMSGTALSADFTLAATATLDGSATTTRLDYVPGIGSYSATATQSINTDTYTAAANGTRVPVQWVNSVFDLTLNVSGIEKSYLVADGNIAVALYKTDDNNALIDNAYNNRYAVDMAMGDFSYTEVEDGVLIPNGSIALTITAADYRNLVGLLSGAYRLVLTINTGATYNGLPLSIVRNIDFTVAASGDMLIHYASTSEALSIYSGYDSISGAAQPEIDGLAADGTAGGETVTMFAHMSGMAAPYQKKTTARAMGTNFTANVNGSGGVYGAVYSYDMSDYYGAILHPGLLTSTTPFGCYIRNNIGGMNNITLKTADNAVLSNLSVTITQTAAYAYSIIHAFRITAENGNYCDYDFRYTFDGMPTLARAITSSSSGTVNSPVTVTRGTTDTITVTDRVSNTVLTRFSSTVRQADSLYVYYSADEFAQGTLIAVVTPIDGVMVTSAAEGATLIAPQSTNSAGTIGYNGVQIVLPAFTLSNQTVNPFSITYATTVTPETTGGKYTVTPQISAPAWVLYTYDNSSVTTNDLPSLYRVIALDGTVVPSGGSLDLSRLNYTGADIIKSASNRAYARVIEYSPADGGNMPAGAWSYGYINNVATLLDDAMTLNNGITEFSYLRRSTATNYYVDPNNAEEYFSDSRVGVFRMQARFSDLSRDYAAYVRLRLYPESSYAQDAVEYNDEYTSVYLMTLNGDTWTVGDELTKTAVDEDGDGVVDYYYVQTLVPETAVVRVRVVAENPLYYTDYEFNSNGPLRNKTLSVTVKVAEENAILGTAIGVMRFISSSRASSFLLALSTDAVAVNGYYSITYTSTGHSAGVFQLETMQTSGSMFRLAITSATVSITPDPVREVTENSFLVDTDASVTVNVELLLTIEKAADMPWGDRVFG